MGLRFKVGKVTAVLGLGLGPEVGARGVMTEVPGK